MTPFILESRQKLPPEPEPSTEEEYDQVLQLWIDRRTGKPLVTRFRAGMEPSQYGETSLTDTREGADQPDRALGASAYGETSLTKTREGADKTESSSLEASSYGETSHTATREGADQPDRSIGASPYGETTETRTHEGADRTEVSSEANSALVSACSRSLRPDVAQLTSLSLSHAPHSHF
jgi:hypothetical protein